ncbi:MAG TPA: diguanylate cyclase [Anaerolineales bacterium]|nr:diguanylate cyclase [Anaerolineales bacterium]
MKDFDSRNPFLRVDMLTGCNNLVSFSKSLEDNFGNTIFERSSLLIVDLQQLRDINRSTGFDHGDKLLRWLGIAIKDETETTVYRISGGNFVAMLIGGRHKTHEATARKLFDRLNKEAEQLQVELPVVRMALLHFPDSVPLNPSVVWKNLNEKMELTTAEEPFQVFHADTSEDDVATLRAIDLMAKRIETLGGTLQYTFKLAYTDPVSNAPNMLAIQRRLDLSLSEAILESKHLSLCLIDGDNLKQYNKHGYAAGDDVIRKIASTLGTALRPNDFLGRWRMGDEFIIILPSTSVEQASAVAERLCASIESASQGWLKYTTISIGIAYFPKHGDTANKLLEAAERALELAKMGGKNRVIVAH